MKRKQYTRGLRVGVPISLGYLAVAFTMGITARNAGLSAVQATLTSFLVNASAGQYAAFTLMAAQGGYLEMAILELVTNARYLLMSCSLSQKLSPKTKLWQRLTVGFAVTDEMFGMAIAEPEEVSPWYYFGMMSIAIPGWSLGTFLGTTVGNILPANVVSALSVGPVRHVPGGHHPRCPEEQADLGRGGSVHGRQLPAGEPADFCRDRFGHEAHPVDGRPL